MTPTAEKLVAMENQFWQSMVDQDADTAVELLSEPALMVSSFGAIEFDHAGYRKMADQGTMVVTSFELSDMKVLCPNEDTAVLTYRVKQGVAPRGDRGKRVSQEMNDTSTWIRADGDWKCVVHTETPAEAKSK